ncbi:MAG: FecR domain-containing protein, partial [Spirochaetaceae bacterium]
MKMVSRCVAMVLMLHVAVSLSAQVVGNLDYFDGEVRISRGNQVFDAWDLGFGEPLSEGEVVETGATGTADFVFVDSVGASMLIQANSAYTVSLRDNGAGGGETEAGVDLLFGRVRVVADGLRENRSLNVRSGAVVAGVRGTEFDVMTAPDGAVIVGTRSGSVATRTDRGEQVAEPGTVVEVLSSGVMSSVNVPVERMDDYFEVWLDLRTQAFSSNPVLFVQPYLERFDRQYPTLETAAEGLLPFRERLEESVFRPELRASDAVNLRTQAAVSVLSTRSSLGQFEETYFTLVQLVGLMSDAD